MENPQYSKSCRNFFSLVRVFGNNLFLSFWVIFFRCCKKRNCLIEGNYERYKLMRSLTPEEEREKEKLDHLFFSFDLKKMKKNYTWKSFKFPTEKKFLLLRENRYYYYYCNIHLVIWSIPLLLPSFFRCERLFFFLCWQKSNQNLLQARMLSVRDFLAIGHYWKMRFKGDYRISSFAIIVVEVGAFRGRRMRKKRCLPRFFVQKMF